MTDRNKIITQLEICKAAYHTHKCPQDCPLFRTDDCYFINMSAALELLKEDERRLQEFNRTCYMSDNLPPIGGFHDGSCEEDDLYDIPIGGFHD